MSKYIMASGPQFLQHFSKVHKEPFETLRVDICKDDYKCENKFIELNGTTYLFLARFDSQYAPFSLFNLETGREIQKRLANPVIVDDREIERVLAKVDKSVSIGNKVIVHFQSVVSSFDVYCFEVVYELRDNTLYEVETTPMHMVNHTGDNLQYAAFVNMNTMLYTNVEGVFMKSFGSDTPAKRICDTPDDNIMLGENIILKHTIEIDPEDTEQDDDELPFELYMLSAPYDIRENMTTLDTKCVGVAVHGDEIVFVSKRNYVLHIKKYKKGTEPIELYALDKFSVHVNIEFDGRYIVHKIWENYNENAKFFDTKTNTFVQVEENKINFASFTNWGCIILGDEELFIKTHTQKSIMFNDTSWSKVRENDGTSKDAFYRYGIESVSISPNKQYLLIHLQSDYSYVMDVQVFYDTFVLLDAYVQYIEPLLLVRGATLFNTGPAQSAINFVLRDQMPEIPDIIIRMQNYSRLRQRCLKNVPLPPAISKLQMSLPDLFASTLQMTPAHATSHISKKSRKLLTKEMFRQFVSL